MKTLILEQRHVGPVQIQPLYGPGGWGPIVVGSGEYLIESYTLVRPDFGPEYSMYRDSPPPWMKSGR